MIPDLIIRYLLGHFKPLFQEQNEFLINPINLSP